MGCGASTPVVSTPPVSSSNNKREITSVVIKSEDLVTSRGDNPQDYYEFGQKVGEGSFGIVRLLRHKATGVERAMKIVAKSNNSTTAIRDEIAILAKLDHPHLVRLIEYFEDDYNFYLVFEHYRGGELFDRIKNYRQYGEAYASNIIKQVLLALNYCHERGIIHRDLKPENLILETANDDSPVRIIDFGTASLFDTKQGSKKKLTKVVGTPYYIAPEVIKQEYDEKCDLWSVGVILFILLSGKPPFFGDDNARIMASVRHGKYSFRDPIWAEISDDAKNLIRSLLTYDPSKRPSASEALKHSWFEKSTKSNTGGSGERQAVEQLKAFSQAFVLQRAIMAYVSAQFTSREERESMTVVFKALDTNGDGKLSRAELQAGFERHFGKMTVAEIDQIFDAADIDKSGEIDYSEFLAATMNRNLICNAEKLKATFKDFDRDGSGKISADELAMVFRGKENAVDALEIWKRALVDGDENSDGEMDASEFAKLMLDVLRKSDSIESGNSTQHDEGGEKNLNRQQPQVV